MLISQAFVDYSFRGEKFNPVAVEVVALPSLVVAENLPPVDKENAAAAKYVDAETFSITRDTRSSKGIACKCNLKKVEKMKNWVVVTYRGNKSAFNGYKFTPSEFSEIKCNKCGNTWRTKMNYVQIILNKTQCSNIAQ